MANVSNYFEKPASGSDDNKLNIDGTLDIGTNATFKIGGTQVTGLSSLAEKLNNLDSVEEVANKSGSPMTAGALVYISGYDTTLDKPIVSLADADDATKKATLVLTEAIADSKSGSAEPVATITGLNTSAASAVGSLVYESTVAGGFTFTAPTAADDDRRCVGVVKVKDATVGEIYFFPGKGGLEHANVYLNNLTAGTASAGGALVVDSNKDIAGIRNLGATNIDAGLSGTAGSIDIFPTTASSGKTSLTSSDNTGDTVTTINIAAQANTRTLTVPDGGNATANFLLSEGAQTINGVQTYTAPQVIDTNTGITAFATGGQANATALTGEYNDVTTVASAYDSVKLLSAVLGQVQVVKNSGAAILSVFPNTDDTINALAANLSVDIPVGGEVTFRAISATGWETNEVLYVSSPTTQTGGLAIKATANSGNTDVTLTNASHGQATEIRFVDSGLSTSYVPQSTAALTVAEMDVLDGASYNSGNQVASKVPVLDANINIGVVKATELHIGSTGAETKVDATPAELNQKEFTVTLADVSTASSAYFVSPVAGTFSKLYSVLYGTIATADDAITTEINGTAVTDGGLTIAYSGSNAGDVDSATPSALNTVAVGDVIEVITSGASTNTVSATFTFVITL